LNIEEKDSMTGRERVKACLEFTPPDRVPRDLWPLPYITLFRRKEFETLIKEYPLDICSRQLSPFWNQDVVLSSKTIGSYTDAWGSVWYVGEIGVTGEVKKPALENWSDLKMYQPPWDLYRKRDIDFINKSCDLSDKFMLSDITARLFERLQFLRGSENLYLDIAYGSSEFRKLLEMVHEFYVKDIESWCKSNVDGIFFLDDWGTNDSLLIDPETWREIFKPLYKEYCDIIHGVGKYAFYHSDGYTESIYGDLIEVGIDAINSQLFCMDMEELARKYKGKVTFWGEIDRQHVLPFGTVEDVEEAVFRVRKAFDDGKGGVIAQCEWGKDNPFSNIKTVFETWTKSIPK